MSDELDLDSILRTLEPSLHDGVYVFAVLPRDMDPASLPALAMIREDEGLTAILAESKAKEVGLPVLYRAAWITLNVRSDLHAVGLTAAVSAALAEAGISCNVIAAAHHDHLFVPVERAEEALRRLKALQLEASR